MTKIVSNPEDASRYAVLLDGLVVHRRMLGLSQREVARLIGCSNSSVHYLEKKAKEPSVPMLQAYCRALGGELKIDFIPDES